MAPKWFKSKFGKKNKKENPQDPLIKELHSKILPQAGTKENTKKTDVKNKFRNIVSEIKNPISQQIIRATNREQFEKAFKKISDNKINHMSAIKASVYYSKFLLLYSSDASKIVMEGNPKGAGAQIEGIIEANDFDEKVQEKLLKFAARIKTILTIAWKISIKLIDNLFESQKGAKILANLANTSDNLNDQQTKITLQKTAAQLTAAQAQAKQNTYRTQQPKTPPKTPPLPSPNSQTTPSSPPPSSQTTPPPPPPRERKPLIQTEKMKKEEFIGKISAGVTQIMLYVYNPDINASKLPSIKTNLEKIVAENDAQKSELEEKIKNSKFESQRAQYREQLENADKLSKFIPFLFKVINKVSGVEKSLTISEQDMNDASGNIQHIEESKIEAKYKTQWNAIRRAVEGISAQVGFLQRQR